MSGKHAASFWQSTWAMLTALATVLLALVGLAGFLVNEHRSGALDVAWTPPPGEHPPIDRVVKVDERDVMWGPREFRLERLMRVNLDGSLVRDGDGADLFSWGGAQMSNSYGLYLWTSTQPPTATDCATFLVTHGTGDYILIAEETTLCVQTNEGRVAVVQFKQRDESDAWLVDAKVWREQVLG